MICINDQTSFLIFLDYMEEHGYDRFLSIEEFHNTDYSCNDIIVDNDYWGCGDCGGSRGDGFGDGSGLINGDGESEGDTYDSVSS